MATPPMIIQVRSGLARPPVTLSCSTSAWNCCRRGVSGSFEVAGISAVTGMVLLCSVRRRGGAAEVGSAELLGDLVWWTGAGDAAVQHDRSRGRHAEDGLRELFDDEDGETVVRE